MGNLLAVQRAVYSDAKMAVQRVELMAAPRVGSRVEMKAHCWAATMVVRLDPQ